MICPIKYAHVSWWRHQIETFSPLLVICAGNSPVPGEFPTQRPVTRSFDVYFDLRLKKRLCKQSWAWWFETLLCPLWCHSNVLCSFLVMAIWSLLIYECIWYICPCPSWLHHLHWRSHLIIWQYSHLDIKALYFLKSYQWFSARKI